MKEHGRPISVATDEHPVLKDKDLRHIVFGELFNAEHMHPRDVCRSVVDVAQVWGTDEYVYKLACDALQLQDMPDKTHEERYKNVCALLDKPLTREVVDRLAPYGDVVLRRYCAAEVNGDHSKILHLKVPSIHAVYAEIALQAFEKDYAAVNYMCNRDAHDTGYRNFMLSHDMGSLDKARVMRVLEPGNTVTVIRSVVTGPRNFVVVSVTTEPKIHANLRDTTDDRVWTYKRFIQGTRVYQHLFQDGGSVYGEVQLLLP